MGPDLGVIYSAGVVWFSIYKSLALSWVGVGINVREFIGLPCALTARCGSLAIRQKELSLVPQDRCPSDMVVDFAVRNLPVREPPTRRPRGCLISPVHAARPGHPGRHSVPSGVSGSSCTYLSSRATVAWEGLQQVPHRKVYDDVA